MRWLLGVVASVAVVGCHSDDSFPPASASDQRYAAEAYARDDIACQTDADCCAVVDPCRNDALVVGATDRADVEGLLAGATPSDGSSCTGCIPPAVQVSCSAGVCVGASVGTTVTDEATLEKLRQTHCGSLSLPESSGAQMRVISCGG